MRYYTIALSSIEEETQKFTDMLARIVPERRDTLQEARKIRNAIKLLFGDSVEVEIRSMDDRVI